jgi:hypothetical protein
MVYHKKRVNRRWDYSEARHLMGYALLAGRGRVAPSCFSLKATTKDLGARIGPAPRRPRNAARRPARGEFPCPILYRRIFGTRSSLAKITGTRGAKIAQPLAVCSAQIPDRMARPGGFPYYAGGVPHGTI